jgi:hypothetical protein
MSDLPLRSLRNYSSFLAELLADSRVERSTVTVWFKNGIRLRLREELDFDAGLITSYGYEVYRGETRLYWYDDFPHPNDPTLASTFPHHKHVPPDIKRNRVPAPGLSFDAQNLPLILQEIRAIGEP